MWKLCHLFILQIDLTTALGSFQLPTVPAMIEKHIRDTYTGFGRLTFGYAGQNLCNRRIKE
jgi:hypothetical protein